VASRGQTHHAEEGANFGKGDVAVLLPHVPPPIDRLQHEEHDAHGAGELPFEKDEDEDEREEVGEEDEGGLYDRGVTRVVGLAVHEVGDEPRQAEAEEDVEDIRAQHVAHGHVALAVARDED